MSKVKCIKCGRDCSDMPTGNSVKCKCGYPVMRSLINSVCAEMDVKPDYVESILKSCGFSPVY